MAATTLLVAALAIGAAAGLTIPASPEGRVNDYAQLLSQAERQRLESRLTVYERESTNQIVVAVFRALEGEDLEDFTNRLFEAWRLGSRELNNGVLLTVFLEERKVRIEPGYGLEAVLTDALARRIIEREIVPRFRRGDFASGIEAACEAIHAVTRGEYRAEPRRRVRGAVPWIALLLLLVAIILAKSVGAVQYASGGRRRYYRRGPWTWGGGGGGGWGGGGFGGGFSGGGGLSGGGGASGSW